MKKIIFFSAALFSLSLSAQKNAAPTKAPDNWFNLSYSTDGVRGVGTERTYTDLLKGKVADTIIVAVIDGGVDYTHEDLKDIMWHNPKEIPGNGIDDDKNGYVDDIYGWNFIGGADGKDVQYDNLELVRLYRPLYNKYKNRDATSVGPSEQDEYNQYLAYKTAYDKDVNTYTGYRKTYTFLKSYLRDIASQQHTDSATFQNFKDFVPGESYKKIHMILKLTIKTEDDYREFVKGIAEGETEINNHLDYQMNLDYDPRSIVGDNYDDVNEHYYGNPDVKGPDALHGTHVAGIIAANRMNNIGILGVNSAVRIMAVRVVPNGDERDKDVANGIRYAVDNGAKVINMSFGKAYCKDKAIVDAAVKYAEAHGVLLVHAAGNDNKDNDNSNNFPNSHYLDGGVASNWIEVGALSWKSGKDQVASFSNYGQTRVDVFAPGVDIHSCQSNGGYLDESGTSMASPVTAGVAAMLKVYYPNLTPPQIREIIMKSSDKSLKKKKVIKPGEKKKKIKFGKLSVSGGTVDLYAAMQLAATYK
ncbi:MAG TPA: S8 family serine peptidase [Bacteroidia bacterium]|jgi:subtilisin family serine protease|nr:S8 family serine peptidase [Bacteroidia bacterium]